MCFQILCFQKNISFVLCTREILSLYPAWAGWSEFNPIAHRVYVSCKTYNQVHQQFILSLILNNIIMMIYHLFSAKKPFRTLLISKIFRGLCNLAPTPSWGMCPLTPATACLLHIAKTEAGSHERFLPWETERFYLFVRSASRDIKL